MTAILCGRSLLPHHPPMSRNKANRRKALVTGAAGYVGRHLTEYLLTRGWNVSGLIRKNSIRRELESLMPEVLLFDCDGTFKSVNEILGESKPDVVFHLVSHISLDHSPDEIDNLFNSNILLGTQLLEAMVANGTRYFINTGSHWQHYKGSSYNPVNLYAATKQAFEDILIYYTEATAIRSLTLKLFNVYGPLDPRNKLFNLFEKAAHNREALAVTEGKQLLDFVYIDDVVRAYEHAANLLPDMPENIHYKSFAVSSGKPVSLRQAARIYENATGDKLKLKWGELPYRKREVMRPWRGRMLPGWKPRVDLAAGIIKICRSGATKKLQKARG